MNLIIIRPARDHLLLEQTGLQNKDCEALPSIIFGPLSISRPFVMLHQPWSWICEVALIVIRENHRISNCSQVRHRHRKWPVQGMKTPSTSLAMSSDHQTLLGLQPLILTHRHTHKPLTVPPELISSKVWLWQIEVSMKLPVSCSQCSSLFSSSSVFQIHRRSQRHLISWRISLRSICPHLRHFFNLSMPLLLLHYYHQYQSSQSDGPFLAKLHQQSSGCRKLWPPCCTNTGFLLESHFVDACFLLHFNPCINHVKSRPEVDEWPTTKCLC